MTLTKEEWDEMNVLRKAINYGPSQVHPDKMQRFTELLVKSMGGKGEPTKTV
jgi:hypothetical protein